MSVYSFLTEREYGSLASPVYHKSHQAIKNKLEKLAAAPRINQPCEFSGEPRATFLVDFSPNRTKVASTHGDHTVRVTEITSGKCTHILTGHPRTPWCLAFHPASNDILASGCLGGEVHIWDLRGGGSEVWKSNNNSVISSLTFHPNDHVLVFATSNTVYFWDWSKPQPFACCRTNYEYERVRWLRFDCFGHYLFTGICNNTTLQRVHVSNVAHASGTNTRMPASQAPNPSQQHLQANRIRTEFDINRIRTEFDINRIRTEFDINRIRHQQHLQANRIRYQQLLQSFYSYQQDRVRMRRRLADPQDWEPVQEDESYHRASPVHIDALSQAHAYATYVTEQSRGSPRAATNVSNPSQTSGGTERGASSGKSDNYTEGEWLEETNSFKNLGASLSKDSNSTTDIHIRIAANSSNRYRNSGVLPHRGSLSPPPRPPGDRYDLAGSGPALVRFAISRHCFSPNSENLNSEEHPQSDSTVRSNSSQNNDSGPILGRRQRLRHRSTFSEWSANARERNLLGQSANATNNDQLGRSATDGEQLGQLASAVDGNQLEYFTRSADSDQVEQATFTSDSDQLGHSANTINSNQSLNRSVRTEDSQTALSGLPSSHAKQDDSANLSGPSSTSISQVNDPERTERGRAKGCSKECETFQSGNSSDHPLGVHSQARTEHVVNCSQNAVSHERSTSYAISGDSLPASVASDRNYVESESTSGSSSGTCDRTDNSFTAEARSSLVDNLQDAGMAQRQSCAAQSYVGKRSHSTAFGAAQPATLQSVCSPSRLESRQKSENVNLLPAAAEAAQGTVSLPSLSRVSSQSLALPLSEASDQAARPQNPAVGNQAAMVQNQNGLSRSSSHPARIARRTSWGSNIPRQVGSSAFRQVLPSQDFRASVEPCSHGSSSSSSSMCPICGNFNMDLLQSRRAFLTSVPSSSASGASGQVSWASSIPSTSHFSFGFGSGVPRSLSTSNVLLGRENHLGADARGDGQGRSVQHYYVKADGASQTLGSLNVPELADQGTDINGLVGADPEDDSEVMNEEDDEESASLSPEPGQAPEDAVTSLDTIISQPFHPSTSHLQFSAIDHEDPAYTLGQANDNAGSTTAVIQESVLNHNSPESLSSGMPAVVHVQDDGSCVNNVDAERQRSWKIVPQSEPPLQPPTAESRRQVLEGLTQHLEQQVHELNQRISDLQDTFSTRLHMLYADRRRLLSTLHGDRTRSSQLSTFSSPSTSSLTASASSSRDNLASQPQGTLRSNREDRDLPLTRTFIPESGRRTGLSPMLHSRLPVRDLPTSCTSTSSHIPDPTPASEQEGSSTTSSSASILTSRQGIASECDSAPRTNTIVPIVSISRPRRSAESSSGFSLGSASQHEQESILRSDLAPSSHSHLVTGPASACERGDQRVEVLGVTGEREVISYQELARRVANREDFTVVGEHRPPGSSRNPSTQCTLDPPRGQHPLLETFMHNDPFPIRPGPLPTIRVDHSVSQDNSQHQDTDNDDQGVGEETSWHSLQQHHLHPHYSVSILDETINRPYTFQAAINRVIAGAFMSTGEQAVASNIVPQTHRIQRWDFRQCQIPDLTQSKANIVVEHCKLHNDASVELSRDGSLLATFIPSHRGFPDSNILAVFSLQPHSFGQCLYTKSFGPNAISVSLSPENHFVLVGLAAKRLSWVYSPSQLVAQIYKLVEQNAGEFSMKHVSDVFHPATSEGRSHVSVNSARWLPEAGGGIVYGTNRGDLNFYRAGVPEPPAELLSHEDKMSVALTSTIGTQTGTGSIHRSTFTQTSEEDATSS